MFRGTWESDGSSDPVEVRVVFLKPVHTKDDWVISERDELERVGFKMCRS